MGEKQLQWTMDFRVNDRYHEVAELNCAACVWSQGGTVSVDGGLCLGTWSIPCGLAPDIALWDCWSLLGWLQRCLRLLSVGLNVCCKECIS